MIPQLAQGVGVDEGRGATGFRSDGRGREGRTPESYAARVVRPEHALPAGPTQDGPESLGSFVQSR